MSAVQIPKATSQTCGVCLRAQTPRKAMNPGKVGERWTATRSFSWEPIRSSGTQSDVCPVAGGGGRNSIQEFTAANPYNPSPEKTVGVRFSESTHAERPPSVRRHRRLFLPELSRVTAHALPRTDGCEETRTIDMSLWHYRMTDFRPRYGSQRKPPCDRRLLSISKCPSALSL